MPTNVLLLPLLAGFWVLHRCHYFRFRAQTLDGYRLLIESALVGVVLAVLARLVTFYVSYSDLWTGCCSVAYSRLRPDVQFLGTSLVSLAIGFCLPFLINLVIRQKSAKKWAINKYGNNLVKLLYGAVTQERTISVSLDNRKVYIGFVADAPNLSSLDSHLTIFPLLSGYRDDKTLELRFTTDYASVAEQQTQDLSPFQVTVPITSIKVASFFDEQAYRNFFIEEEPGSQPASVPLSPEADIPPS